MDTLKNMIKSYETWVATNPETVCDLETTTKWVSYFIAGRISDSNIVSELVYSLSNIMVFYNDRIIEKKRHLVFNSPNAAGPSRIGIYRPIVDDYQMQADGKGNNNKLCYRIKVILTTLEYCEVFIEISAKRVFGTRGRWFFIVLLQTLKAAGRFFILKHSTSQIITSPAIASLNRRAVIKQQKTATKNISANIASTGFAAAGLNNNTKREEHSFTFKLKRSGRIVRKVEGAPPLQYRDFKMLTGESTSADTSSCIVPNMPFDLLKAEYLYIAKPLMHLAAIGCFGDKRWKQYMIALALDFASLRLYHKNKHLLSKEQRLEISRRCVNALLYLMRSPFYERFTQSRLERAIDFIGNNVPLLKLIAGPLREYVPHWQSTYFYLWST